MSWNSQAFGSATATCEYRRNCNLSALPFRWRLCLAVPCFRSLTSRFATEWCRQSCRALTLALSYLSPFDFPRQGFQAVLFRCRLFRLDNLFYYLKGDLYAIVF